MLRKLSLTALCAAPLALAACQQSGSQSEAGAPTPQATPAPSATESPPVTPTPSAEPSETTPAGGAPDDLAASIPEDEKGEKAALNVLLDWAHALEQGDYAKAYSQWGDGGKRSGKSAKQFAEYWSDFKTIHVETGKGRSEGAAGSIYYTAPATITGQRTDGKPYKLGGTVTLRRVNDVPGASAEQLHWHLESTDLKDVG